MILLQTSTTTTVANPYILALIALIGPIAVVIISWLNTKITAKMQREMSDNTVKLQRELTEMNLDEKRIEEKRKEISKRLDDFYGPLQQYLNKSHDLYEIFKRGKPANFRTLTYLLDKEQIFPDGTKVKLTDNDKVIFSEIIAIGKKIEELILSKASLSDDSRLTYHYEPSQEEKTVIPEDNSGLLSLLGTHLLVIRHAYEDRIIGQAADYKNRVFPRAITKILKENVDRLNKELSELRS